MTDHPPPPPPQATRLHLPSAALHTSTQVEAHPDSEEAVRHESRRVSRELTSIHHHQYQSTNAQRASQAPPSFASLRSRNAGSATSSHEPLRRRASGASTVSDEREASEFITAHSVRSSLQEPRWYTAMARFWNTHICPTIDEGAFRDHLALERTFLGYLRTSLVLVMTGILIAQLFRLQRTAHPDPMLGFYVIGKPLSIAFISLAIVVLIVGALRFWRLQRGLSRGKALAAGWEVLLVMGSCAILMVGTFVVVLGVTVDKALDGG